MGFVGAVTVLLLLLGISVRILLAALQSTDALGRYLCVGIFAALFWQCIINLGMNLQVLPVIGVTLPFFSAGGSSVVMGYFVVTTTTVSEFVAAMERLHLPQQITIPMSVMFRFFPTIADEFSSINDAMRMRDIRFGGKNVTKMIEYRLVPLLVCSAKIGEELNAAAITRGLGADRKRTNVCQIGFHAQDYILFTLCVIPYVIWAGALIRSLIV